MIYSTTVFGFFSAHLVLTPCDPWDTVFGLDASFTVRVSPSNQPGGNFLISGSQAKRSRLLRADTCAWKSEVVGSIPTRVSGSDSVASLCQGTLTCTLR